MSLLPLAVIDAKRAGTQIDTLLDSTQEILPHCLIGDNFDLVGDTTLVSHRERTYGRRSETFPAVDLVRLPPGVTLTGGRFFLLALRDGLIKEQVPPADVLAGTEEIQSLLKTDKLVVEIGEDVLLASRWGMMTWGHWIGEIYPRLALTESFFPGRFKFALPQDIYNASPVRNVWNSILESVFALGITRDRIIQVFYDRDYSFTNLFIVTDTFIRNKFHPAALRLIRQSLGVQRFMNCSTLERKVAILRTESKARNVTNLDVVAGLFGKSDFEFVEIGRLPFREQICLFATSTTIAGVLASGLTGLVFSRPNVNVLTLAPVGYVNEFFPPLVQAVEGHIWDVRGPITRRDPRSDIFSDFEIEAKHLDKAISELP